MASDSQILDERRRTRMLQALRKAQLSLTAVFDLPAREEARNRTLLMNAWSKLHLSQGAHNEIFDLPTRCLFCLEEAPIGSEENKLLITFAKLMSKYHEREWRMLSKLGSHRIEELEELFGAEGVPLTPAFCLFHRFYQKGMARSEDKDLLPTDWAVV